MTTTGRHYATTSRKVERDLYLAQRDLGDVRVATTQGPGALARRIVRRHVHRAIFRGLRRLGL